MCRERINLINKAMYGFPTVWISHPQLQCVRTTHLSSDTNSSFDRTSFSELAMRLAHQSTKANDFYPYSLVLDSMFI